MISIEAMDEKIERLKNKTNDIRHLEAELKAQKQDRTSLEFELLDMLDDLGLTTGGTGTATISISEQMVPNVDKDHWEDVWTFLFENGYTEVLRRQLNSGSYKDLLALGIEVPHVTPFMKRSLNLRKRN